MCITPGPLFCDGAMAASETQQVLPTSGETLEEATKLDDIGHEDSSLLDGGDLGEGEVEADESALSLLDDAGEGDGVQIEDPVRYYLPHKRHLHLLPLAQEIEAIKARVKEMEEEAEKLKEMQGEVEKQLMGSKPGSSSPLNSILD